MTSSALDSLPTLFPRLMPVRQWDLLTAVAAQSYTPSPPPLVGIVQADSGVAYRALGATDDAGLFYLLPKLVAFLNLPLNVVWALWFFGLLALALAAGIYSTLRLLQSPLAKALYLIELVVLTVLIVKVGDVYQLAPCLALVGVPLALQYFSKPIDEKRFRIGMAALVAAGVIFGWAHLIRAHSATAVLLFIGTLLLCATQIAWPKRGLLLAALIIGFVLPQVYMKPVFDARDSFLQARVGYRSIARQHPFWHSVYIGFGYLSNEYGLAYKDEVAEKKVREIAPDAEYCSPEYEAALRKAVIDLVRQDYRFVVQTLLAKSGILLISLCIAANIGLIAAIRRPKSWEIELAFGLAIGFSALPGILVMVRPPYILGFFAFAMLYGVFSLDAALQRTQVASSLAS